jgi:glucose/arabinose dehydrogenase/plastocyanin
MTHAPIATKKRCRWHLACWLGPPPYHRVSCGIVVLHMGVLKMHGFRLASFVLMLALISGGLLSASAQDATPAPDAMPGPDGTPLPSQYAFYPSQVAQPGGDLPGDPQIQLVKVADGLAEPVNVAAPKDGSGRIFVVERGGTIRIVDSNGQVQSEPFLDISGDVAKEFLEQGLLGLAFHPDYANNGLFYINYTNLLHGGDVLTMQYKVSADDPNTADPNSGMIVSSRDQPYPNHIGGDIHFGPDGYLYIGHGDGGLEGDPLDAGQDLATHLGKMLRIDVSPAVAAATGQEHAQAAVGGHAYTIPPTNPFTQGDIVIDLFEATEEDFARLHPQAQPEIWAYGLRNPWSFSFDRQTGDLWIGDVGQNFWEEINFERANSGGGWNYGWKFLQGSHCFPASMEDCPKVGVLPVAEYEHSEEGGCTVVGGSVYRGEVSTNLNGIYFASDYCAGRIWGIALDDQGEWTMQELLDTSLLVTGSGEDEAGEIYFTSCECGYGQRQPNPVGSLWRLVTADQVPGDAETAPTGTPEATPAAGEFAATPEGVEASPATDTAAGGAGDEITVESVDIDFNPNEFTIPANTDVTIHLPNNGAAQHNFSVEELEIDADIAPGEEQTITINAPAGEYEYYCDVPGHSEAGMVGTMTVE